MITFLFCLVSSSIAEDDLRHILKSPKATLQLYSTFKYGNGLQYSRNEDPMRFRMFLKNAEFVADLSERDHEATYGLNLFSSMTVDEKKHYLGLNRTQQVKETLLHRQLQSGRLSRPPSYKLWTNLGAVTEVKNQGGCGSCWAFGAVGALETVYFKQAGVLRNFAEQEYLDCVYKVRDGCDGGWHGSCYEYSVANGKRLASTTDYKYTAKDGPCLKNSKPNAMVAAEITDYKIVPMNEAANIAALAEGALAVAFEVTDATFQYSGGIFRDRSCRSWSNHVVTAVGYTPKFVLVKNSWGSWWGDKGFIKFSRNHRNCGLFLESRLPVLRRTGKSDNTPSDVATTYRAQEPEPKPEPKPEPILTCRDINRNCKNFDCSKNTRWLNENCAKTCKKCKSEHDSDTPTCRDVYSRCRAELCKKNSPWVKKNCANTCGTCKKCPPGTTLCGDGVCRHEHMCH